MGIFSPPDVGAPPPPPPAPPLAAHAPTLANAGIQARAAQARSQQLAAAGSAMTGKAEGWAKKTSGPADGAALPLASKTILGA